MSPAPSDPPPDPSRPVTVRPTIGQGARYEVAIGPSDVGQRVSVRYLLRGESPNDPDVLMTDVVGHLEAWTDGLASVTRRTGETVDVEITKIVAAKVVPPAPTSPRRS